MICSNARGIFVAGLAASVLALSAETAVAQAHASGQLFAELGECPVEAGGTIRDCRVGYRTFGVLNAERSNAVLVPSWFGGTSEALAGFIRPGVLVDPERWFVIVADAFGNGVSSSPSNSPTQAGEAFPSFSIGDMVEAQRRLLRDDLGVESLAGVVGISMGGMQAFEWAVRYPGDVESAVSIAGTPRAGVFDRVAWDAYLRLMRLMDTAAETDAEAILAALEYLRGTSPAFVARTIAFDSVPALLETIATTATTAAERMDLASQARAVSRFDVAAPYGGDLSRAADRVAARLTIITTKSDHQVTPFTSIDFAEMADAVLLLLDNDCGHAGANCDARKALGAVAATLEGRPVEGPDDS